MAKFRGMVVARTGKIYWSWDTDIHDNIKRMYDLRDTLYNLTSIDIIPVGESMTSERQSDWQIVYCSERHGWLDEDFESRIWDEHLSTIKSFNPVRSDTLNLTDCKRLKRSPDGLVVGKALCIHGCEDLVIVPSELRVGSVIG